MKDYLTQAIKLLKPDSEFVYTDNDYSTINWIVLEGTAPTQAEIDVAIEQVKAEEAQAAATKATAKAALLEQLGITEEQAKLLLS
jgi:hypothetical protein